MRYPPGLEFQPRADVKLQHGSITSADVSQQANKRKQSSDTDVTTGNLNTDYIFDDIKGFGVLCRCDVALRYVKKKESLYFKDIS